MPELRPEQSKCKTGHLMDLSPILVCIDLALIQTDYNIHSLGFSDPYTVHRGSIRINAAQEQHSMTCSMNEIALHKLD